MKRLKDLPFACELDDARHACVLWQPEPGERFCEYQDEPLGTCDPSGLSYGTSDVNAPVFCARHFYQVAVAGDGVRNYALVERAAETGS